MNRLRSRAVILMTIVAPTLGAQTADVVRNVSYADGGNPEQTMDVYWAGVSRPTVMFIHGGSLQASGERRSSPEYRDVCKPFVAANISCANIDYRLAPANQWPTMPDDVVSAVVKLRSMITRRGGDPKSLFLFGHSSGCHLAAIVSTNPVYLKTAGLSPSDLAGVIPMGCLLDRDDAAIRRLTADVIRAPFQRDAQDIATYGTPENYLAANPASFVGKHVPPVLVVIAHEERYAPPILEQGSRFVRRLRELDKPADIVMVPGKHMSSIASIGKPNDPTFQAVKKFIEDPLSAER